VAGQVASKVKNFLWLMYQNRIQTTDNLIKKQWKGSKFCKFCNSKETVDHLFFSISFIYLYLVCNQRCLKLDKNTEELERF
jgi:hypothetical protein